MTLVGATVAGVWGDIFHYPDDETVLDDTLACVRWMYSEWDGLSGWMGFRKVCPGICLWNGMRFRLRALVENATRNLQSEWDAVSQRGRKRKLHPTPDVNSGTRFPDAKKATRRGLQLIYVADTPMTSRAPTTGRLSRRRHIRFIASSARKEGHLMWPSSCAGP